MCDAKNSEWFREWFDSPYYHMLYRHRDQHEAQAFLVKLLDHLGLPEGASIMDLACGKGRHSIFLHSRGFDVTGVDLSFENVCMARKYEEARLHFEKQDMRTLSLGRKFDCIMNLFTSFGYFKGLDENKLVLSRVKEHLKPDCPFVLDYFNAEKLRKTLTRTHHMECGSVQFDIEKEIQGGRILKNIKVTDGKSISHFQECVQLLTKEDIAIMLQQIGLNPVATFGDYEMNPFDHATSDRFIIIARN